MPIGYLLTTFRRYLLLPFLKSPRMILDMGAEIFIEISLPNCQSAQHNNSQERFIRLPFCPLFISRDVRSIQSVSHNKNTRRQSNDSLILCCRETTFRLIQTETQLPLLSVFTPRKEGAVQQLNISVRAEKRIRINAGKATFKVLSAVLLNVTPCL